jgi:hypothetical protein
MVHLIYQIIRRRQGLSPHPETGNSEREGQPDESAGDTSAPLSDGQDRLASAAALGNSRAGGCTQIPTEDDRADSLELVEAEVARNAQMLLRLNFFT